MKRMRLVVQLKLAIDRLKCDRACTSWLEFSIYFNFVVLDLLGYGEWDSLDFFNVDAVDCKLTPNYKPPTLSLIYKVLALHMFYFPHLYVWRFYSGTK